MKKFYAIFLAVGFLAMGALEVNGYATDKSDPPSFLTRPKEIYTVKVGSVVQFTFRVSGSPTVHAYFEGNQIQFGTDSPYRQYVDGDYVSFIINWVDYDVEGEYSIKLTNRDGTASTKFYVKVEE